MRKMLVVGYKFVGVRIYAEKVIYEIQVLGCRVSMVKNML